LEGAFVPLRVAYAALAAEHSGWSQPQLASDSLADCAFWA